MIWENIGDPVAKGEALPAWMKGIVEAAVREDRTYAYSPTKGDLEARRFILEHYSDPRICTVEDIVFFNGLGEAINKIFSNLPSTARVIGPNPTYPSHATAEAMHHGGHHLTYALKLDDGGRIDVADLARRCAGTTRSSAFSSSTRTTRSASFSRARIRSGRRDRASTTASRLRRDLPRPRVRSVEGGAARRHHRRRARHLDEGHEQGHPVAGQPLRLDRVYTPSTTTTSAATCTIVVSMLEVCSTTLPQVVFPKIVTHPEFRRFLAKRLDKYRSRAERALELFAGCAVIRPIVPDGVFYFTSTFDTARFPNTRKLRSQTKEVRLYLDTLEAANELRRDKLFAYELMGAEGVCVVPLSGFSSPFDGFRMTLLEEDSARFDEACRRIRRGAEEFFQP
jgi:aspartate/methionine/tyrosine aminotransferase